ncbi:MAG: hypothetical protein ACREL1_06100 [bacterium]
MKFQVRTFRAAGWLFPIALLAGLALIPVALFIALSLLGLAFLVGVVRSFLPSASSPAPSQNFSRPSRAPRRSVSDKGVLDVEYEIKDDHEKERE